jgi:hypothetical protein
MMERGLRFIDVDENRLELWLEPDRVQLVVMDSRPELEGNELRRFASVLFAEYVARDLSDRLGAARLRLQEARDRAGDDLTGALDGALHAIDELTAAITVPDPAPDPDPAAPQMPAPGPSAADTTPGHRPYRPLKYVRGKRAGEPSRLGWHHS